jgi:hypothetical protein
MRSLLAALAARGIVVFSALVLWAALALAEPRFTLRYVGDVPRVEIDGSYPQTTYTVWRSESDGRNPQEVGGADVLCLGSCFADDRTAVPGRTYLYRFELRQADGTSVGFGPYAATISPALEKLVGVSVYPNPGRGPAQIELHLAGAVGAPPANADAALFDLAGRRLRTFYRGSLARGVTTLHWDGRDERGVTLPAGTYFVRLAADGRQGLAIVVRSR